MLYKAWSMLHYSIVDIDIAIERERERLGSFYSYELVDNAVYL
jgi:hypothetical protein